MKKKGKKSGIGIAGAHGRPHWALTGALVASTVLSGAAPKTTHAQGGIESRARDAQHTAQTRKFSIPAGSLSSALDAYRAATGLELTINAPVTNLETKGVSGEFTPQQALNNLLDGTGLIYVFTGRHSVVIRARGERADAVLEGVSVQGAKAGKVSSPKYTQAPVDIPQTITVVTSETMEKQGITTLRDAVRNVPGITLNAGEGGNAPGDKFNIRGFSAETDIFVDGVRDISTFSRETFNLEQVEVTKGPNSAITGRGSTGGSINMVTKTPHANASRTGSITVGSASLRRATLDINQPLPEAPSAAIRVAASSSESGVPGNDVVERKSWGIAPSIVLGLGTPTQFLLSHTHSEQNNIPSYGPSTFNEVPTVDTRKFFGLRSLDFEKAKSYVTTFRVDHDFGAARVRNQTSRSHSEVNRIVTPATYPSGARSPKSHINDNTSFVNQTNVSTSFRTGPLQHNLVTGFEIGREDSKRGNYAISTTESGPYPNVGSFDNPNAAADFHPTIRPNISTTARATTLGAYAFETLRINRFVEVSGGARWDSYDPKYTDSASKANANADKIRKSTAVTGRAAVTVKPTEFGSVYASYGTSFNPSNEKLSHESVSATSSLDPEKSRSYEVGTKWDLFKQRLLTSLAFFRTEKTNARTSDPENPGMGTILAGKHRVQGGELGLTGNVNERWNVQAGYSYLESEYVESLNASQVGTPFTNVPKHSVTLWSTYGITPKLSVGGGARYQDKRLLRAASGSNPTTYVPSYHTYDAVASYRLNPLVDLQLNLQNLSDKLYYDSGRMWAPAPGRAFSLGTTVKF